MESKKRKRGSDLASAANKKSTLDVQIGEEGEIGEIEEGELSSSSVEEISMQLTTAHKARRLSLNAVHPLPTKPTVSHTPTLSVGSTPNSLPSNPKIREQEECRSLVDQLLSWEVSPEYLVACGISKELVAICLFDLGYMIPPHLAHLVPRGVGQNQSLKPVPRLPSSPPKLFPLAEDNTLPSQTISQDLTALENKRRRELLQRKLAQAKARQISNDIDGLFAAVQVDQGASESDSSDIQEVEPPAHAEQIAASQHISDVRQSVETAAALVAESSAPFVSHLEGQVTESATLDATGAGLEAPASDLLAASPSSVPILALPPQSRTLRPVASDFESEPSHALPQHPKRLSTGIFIPDASRQTRMVIDLSDGESEAETPSPRATRPPLYRTLSPAGSNDFEETRKKELEAKEKELERMKKILAQLESKKKAQVGSTKGSRPSTPTVSNASLPSVTPSATPLQKIARLEDDKIAATQKQVDLLEEEKEDMIKMAQNTAPNSAAVTSAALLSENLEQVPNSNKATSPSIHDDELSAERLDSGLSAEEDSVSESSSSQLVITDLSTILPASNDTQVGVDTDIQVPILSLTSKILRGGSSLARDPRGAQAGFEPSLADYGIFLQMRDQCESQSLGRDTFTAYNSSLSCFSFVDRLPVLLSYDLPTLSLSLNNYVFATSFTADSDTFLCSFEADGGLCVDASCGKMHFSRVPTPESYVLQYLDVIYADHRLPTSWTTEKIRIFRRGLTVLTSSYSQSSNPLSLQQAQRLFTRAQEFYKRFLA